MPSVSVNGALTARDYESLSAFTASTGLTASKYLKDASVNNVDVKRRAVEVLITFETADSRWTCDGTAPTTTASTAIGHLASAGDAILLSGYAQIFNFRIINAVASNGATAKATFFYKE